MTASFLKDSVRYLPSKILPGLFGVLVLPVLTRLFSPADYGQYTIVVSTIAVLSIFATDWIAPSVIRYYAEYEAKSSLGVFYTTVFVMMCCSIAAVAAVSGAAIFSLKSGISPRIYGYLRVGMILFAAGIAFNVMTQILIVRREIPAYTFYSLWRQCACVAIGIAFAWIFGSGVSGLLWGTAAGIAVALPFLFARSFRELSPSGYSRELRASIMSYGFPLIATNVASWALTLSDRYVIEYFRGSREVGLYSVSYGLADRTIMLAVSVIVLASAPIVMETWERRGEKATAEFIAHVTRCFLVVLAPATVGLALLSEPVTALIAAEEYLEGHRVVPMVAAAAFLFGLQRNFQLALLLRKKTRLIMYIVVLSGIANVLLNLLFVPRYGYIAAGWTTLASYVLFSTATIVVSRKHLAWDFPFRTLRNVAISSAAMAAAVSLGRTADLGPVPLELAALVLLGGAVYVAALLLVDEVRLSDFQQLFAESKK